MKAIPHRFSDDDIYFGVEVLPKRDLDMSFQLVFLDDLLHHEHVLLLPRGFVDNHAVNFAAACPDSKDGVKKIDTVGQMQYSFACKQMLILHDRLMEYLISECVFHTGFEGVHGEEVDFMQMRRELDLSQCRKDLGFVFLGLLLLFGLVFAGWLGFDGEGFGHWTNNSQYYNQYNFSTAGKRQANGYRNKQGSESRISRKQGDYGKDHIACFIDCFILLPIGA